jgi:thiol-disulfide isomerase/thioredoxin
MRRIITAVFMLPLLFVAVCLQASAQQRDASAQQRNAAPAVSGGALPDASKGGGFRLKGLDGKFYDTSEMHGDVLVVSFGATWCVPCTWELVAVEELKEEYAGKPVRFLWVSIDDAKRTTNNILRYYVKDRRLTIPVLRDPDGGVLSQYATGQRIPVAVFFDAEGRLDTPVHHGMSQDIAVYKQFIRDRVNALLSRPQPKTEAGAATR